MELIKFSHDELTKPIQGGFAQSVKSSIIQTLSVTCQGNNILGISC